MEFKALQWNIGGGKDYRDSSKDVLGEVVAVTRKVNPDIITLQEIHSDEGSSQAEEIAKSLGHKHWVEDVYDESHLEKGKMLGQAIVSRWPIENHTFSFFTNPRFKVERPNGDIWITHDKGITTGTVRIGEIELVVQTLHTIPFVAFKVDPLGKAFAENRQELSNLISDNGPLLLQGDFNFDESSLGPLVEKVADGRVLEIVKEESTIRTELLPDKSLLGGDRVLYRGLNVTGYSTIREASADHYPLLVTFSI